MGVTEFLREREYNCRRSPRYRRYKEDLNNWLDSLAAAPALNQPCEFSGEPKATFLVEFSPDGTKIASSHGDHTVRVTEIATGKCTHILTGHPRTPWCLAFHPSHNDILASGCLGGHVRIWDLRGGGSETYTTQARSLIASLTFHPVDNLLVFSTKNEMYFWDWTMSKPTVTCEAKGGSVRWVKFDSHGHYLYTGIHNGQYYNRVSFLHRYENETSNSAGDPGSTSSSSSSSSSTSTSSSSDGVSNTNSNISSSILPPTVYPNLEQRFQTQQNYLRVLELGLHNPDMLRNMDQATEEQDQPNSPVHEDRLRQAFDYARYVTSSSRELGGLRRLNPSQPGEQRRGRSDGLRISLRECYQAMRRHRVVANSPPPQPPRNSDSDDDSGESGWRNIEEIRMFNEAAAIRRRYERLQAFSRAAAERQENFLERRRRRNRNLFETPSSDIIPGLFRPATRTSDSTNMLPFAREATHQSSDSGQSSVETASSQSTAFNPPSVPSQEARPSFLRFIDRDHSVQQSGQCARTSSPPGIQAGVGSGLPESTHSSVGASSASVPLGEPHNWDDGKGSSRNPERNIQSSSQQLHDATTSSAQLSCLVSPEPVHPPSSFPSEGSTVNSSSRSVLSAQALRFSSASSSSSAFQSVPQTAYHSNSKVDVLGKNDSDKPSSLTDNSTHVKTSMQILTNSDEFVPDSSYIPLVNVEASAAGSNVCVTTESSSTPPSRQSLGTTSLPSVLCSSDHGSSGASSTTSSSGGSGVKRSFSMAFGSDPQPGTSQPVPQDADSSGEANTRTSSAMETAASESSARSGSAREADRAHAASVLRSHLLHRIPPRPPLYRTGNLSSLFTDPVDWRDFQRGSLSCMHLARFLGAYQDRAELRAEIQEIRQLRQSSAYVCDIATTDTYRCPVCLSRRGLFESGASYMRDCRPRRCLRRGNVMPQVLSYLRPGQGTSSASPHILWNDRPEATLDASSQTNRNVSELEHVDQGTDMTDAAPRILNDFQGPSGSGVGEQEESSGSSNSQPREMGGFHTLPSHVERNAQTIEVKRGNDDVHETITYRELARRIANRMDVIVVGSHRQVDPPKPSTSVSEGMSETSKRAGQGHFSGNPVGRGLQRLWQRRYNPPGPVPPPSPLATGSSTTSSSASALHSSGYPSLPRILVQRPSSDDQPQGSSQDTASLNVHPGGLSLPEPDTLHPHYAGSVMDHPRFENVQNYQPAINRAIAGLFMSSGEQAVASNIVPGTFRIQRWDMRQGEIPDLSQTTANVVVQNCKIHNDASVALSSDSSMLAAFVSVHRGFPDENVLSVFSLLEDSFGQCLYTKSFGPNAISVSISPSNKYLLVGLASKRMFFFHVDQQLVGQIYKMVKEKAGEDSMKHTTDVYHPVPRAHVAPRLMSPVSVNSARWLPQIGHGIVYGTNHGDLHFFRSGRTKANVEQEEAKPRKVSMSTQAGQSAIPRPRSVYTQTIEEERCAT